MYFNYVICLSGLIQVMVGNVDSICCDASTPQLFGTSSGNRAIKDTIYKCSNGNDTDKFSDFTADIPISEESSDDTVERFRRANGADAPKCTTNLLRARLGLAAAKTRNSVDELFVAVDPVPVELVLQTVPVPTQLEPPKLLHKQFLALSPYPISGPEPSCSSSGSGPIRVNPNNAQNLGNSSASNVITDIRYIELPRQLPPKPSITGMDAAAIRAPDAEHTYTSNLAALVNARLAQHRQITGQYNIVPITNSASPNGNFIVTSIGSEPAPNIAVETDVGLFGNLIVCGNLPYASAVQFDGIYDTAGEGTVSFGCGPIRENQNLDDKASLNICKSPDVAPQARTQDEIFTASATDEISARFAQHMKSTKQSLQPTSLPVPSCGCDVPGFIKASYYPATETGKPSTPVINSARVSNCKCPELPTLPSIVSPDAQNSGSNMASVMATRLAQHKQLLTGQSNCEYPNCASPCLDTSESRTFIAVPNGGCSLPINSISSEPPGVAVDTNVALSGDIDVSGTLPFMSAVQFQGLCDTVGSGSVAFGAGQPDTGSEDNAAANKRCKYNFPRIPAALPVPPEVVGIIDEPSSTTPLAALVSSRLAQHKLLTEQQCSINPELPARCPGTSISYPTNGLPVTSLSTEPPGIDVDSDIGLCGQLDVSGDLPFQSAVKFQGLYDTKGSGVVSFGCV